MKEAILVDMNPSMMKKERKGKPADGVFMFESWQWRKGDTSLLQLDLERQASKNWRYSEPLNYIRSRWYGSPKVFHGVSY